MSKKENQNKAIIIFGPTCSGKSAAALALAAELGTEIISADSMQIYRLMDIGTAKPTKAALSLVPHHLTDVIWPHEQWSAGSFVREASAIMSRLASEGKIPIIAGGTGLYIRTLTGGLMRAPEADDELRAALCGERDRGQQLHAVLQDRDPETARLLAPSDTRRIIRALEVLFKTGKAISELKGETVPLPYDFIKTGLTRTREELYRLIDERTDRMFEEGLLEEAKRLFALPGPPSKTALQAIGYKELRDHLNGLYPYGEAVRLIKRNTRRYAKRQFTWFKKEEGVLWVDVTGLVSPEEIYGRFREALLESHPEIFSWNPGSNRPPAAS